MKKKSFKAWSHAQCVDCIWELENINAQAVGAKHAEHHHHRVLVTTEIESVYDGRNSKSTETRE